MIGFNEWLSSNQEDIQTLLNSSYGIQGTIQPLVGEFDLNFYIEDENKRYLLKVMRPECDTALVDMQCQALEHLATRQPDLPLQRLIRTQEGSPRTTFTDNTGNERIVWLLSFLPGRPMGETCPHTRHLLTQIGYTLAQIDLALAGFQHPACLRELKWNLRRAAWIQPYLDQIEGKRRRLLVAIIVETFVENVAPQMEQLRRQAIYNDANDYNLLVDYDEGGLQRLSGVIDFGDMSDTTLVGEVAIASAYAMMDKENPLTAAEAIVSGYHRHLPLQDEELALVFPLILTRLAVSVTNSAIARHERPDDPYVTISEAPAWRLLEVIHDYDPRLAEARLRAACGLDPWPRSNRITAWLRQRTGSFAEILGPDLPAAHSAILDQSFASLICGDNPEQFDPDVYSSRIGEAIQQMGKRLAIGRYGEPRPLSKEPDVGGWNVPLHPRRTRHLGIDLFAPAGTHVHAPLAGEVMLARWLPERSDYGGLVVLHHRTDSGEAFEALYGHLARTSVEALQTGQKVEESQAFAVLGDPAENGGWPSHLHIQLLVEGIDDSGTIPLGNSTPEDFLARSAFSPCPAALLNLSDEAATWKSTPTEELRSRRAARFADNIRISYSQPMQPVRGWRHFLYDPQGRAYIDAYNNVPHVGHCHPRVVEAATRQIRLLSTNTRYLYDQLTDYADRLVAKLPTPLSVCFILNSGSEANELALRLARAHTRAKDMLVMDHAYHGNTTGAMDISPYKFNRPEGAAPPDWVHVTPIPDVYRGPFKATDKEAGLKYAALVQEKLESVLASGRGLAGYICESLPSVGGQIVLPEDFLREVYRSVRQAGGVCIVDDVQTALGRIGSHFWGFELQDVIPDILVLGKPIGNGYPLAAVVTTPEIAASFATGPEFFSTFGGNTISCSVGIAVLDVLEEEGLQAHAEKVGKQLLAGLSEIAQRYPLVGDVRGSGLFLGIELVTDRDSLEPATRQASYVKNRMRERRILLGTEGPYDNILKIRPPMTFDTAAANRFLENLDEILAEDLAQPDWCVNAK